MSDERVIISLPQELCRFLDTIRFSETSRVKGKWATLPPSRSDTIESLIWKAYAEVYRTS